MAKSISRAVGVVVFAALVLACAACVPFGGGSGSSGSGPDSTQQYVIDAVHAADPAATTVVAQRATSGLSEGWRIEIDHEGEVTADTLAAILRAVATSDLNPVDIGLYFFAPGTDDPLDIAPAADELGVPWSRVGSGAAWLTGELDALPR